MGKKLVVLVVLLALLVLLICARCGRKDPPPRCTTCPTTSLPPAPSCPATSPPRNEMPNNEMPNNGLSAASLKDNEPLLQALIAGSLYQTSGATVALPAGVPDATAWDALLAHEHAPALTRYIASCALDRCEKLDMPARLKPQFPDGFVGELGLCGATYNASMPPAQQETLWRDAPPTQGCLERVSACVLARVNAIEARVPISLRGDGIALLPRVPVETRYRENHGTPIQSFKACDEMCLWGDPLRRNCDWAPRFVGQCVREQVGGTAPPNQVTLKVTGARPARVRICKGLHGCDDVDPLVGAGAITDAVYAHGTLTRFPRHYGGQMIEQGQHPAGRPFGFECPDNGPLVRDPSGTRWRTGYYSIMVGTTPGGATIAETTDVALVPGTGAAPPAGAALMYGTDDYQLTVAPDAYPATEQQVYTYREGAFYGSIFPAGAVALVSTPDTCAVATSPTCADDAALSGDQFACASKIWKPSAAVMTDRLCAGANEVIASCFVNAPGFCDATCGGKPLCTPVTGATAGPVVYEACGAPAGKLLERPYTSYLSHPCDLFTSDAECFAALAIAEDVAERPEPQIVSGRKVVAKKTE